MSLDRQLEVEANIVEAALVHEPGEEIGHWTLVSTGGQPPAACGAGSKSVYRCSLQYVSCPACLRLMEIHERG